ncbi:hypothetical protein PNK_1729 [Candidatus Protochlamydia naegleriophila]|uniref:Uncharacterized protein n=1 Tax=Candidatus Protochlamydia naegleriophila TaxID=389348 RepID=A0A0U5JBU2_9BACT|nr:hypothetical protein PNK_1729 [Candidatus Protochlamydia naegleriophila]
MCFATPFQNMDLRNGTGAFYAAFLEFSIFSSNDMLASFF